MKKFKLNQKVWVLYVNITTFYISFKIEEGKYLGEIDKKNRMNHKHIYVVEHTDGDVNYLSIDDIFKNEKEAELHLAKMIFEKYNIK